MSLSRRKDCRVCFILWSLQCWGESRAPVVTGRCFSPAAHRAHGWRKAKGQTVTRKVRGGRPHSPSPRQTLKAEREEAAQFIMIIGRLNSYEHLSIQLQGPKPTESDRMERDRSAKAADTHAPLSIMIKTAGLETGEETECGRFKPPPLAASQQHTHFASPEHRDILQGDKEAILNIPEV